MGERLLVRLAAAAAGGALALMAAAPAWAVVRDLVNPLPILAKNINQDCDDERMAAREAGEDGWHFAASGGSIVSIEVTFASDPDNPGASMKTFTGTPASPGEFTFDSSGSNANEHAYLFTPAGWLLLSAAADVEGTQQFNLIHTCAGAPPTTESPTTTEPPPTTETPPTTPSDGTTPPSTPPTDGTTPPGTAPPGKGGKPSLPVTGMSVGGLLILSGGLLSAGIALMAVRRRRSLSNLLDN